jgi:hypothetical protein
MCTFLFSLKGASTPFQNSELRKSRIIFHGALTESKSWSRAGKGI